MKSRLAEIIAARESTAGGAGLPETILSRVTDEDLRQLFEERQRIDELNKDLARGVTISHTDAESDEDSKIRSSSDELSGGSHGDKSSGSGNSNPPLLRMGVGRVSGEIALSAADVAGVVNKGTSEKPSFPVILSSDKFAREHVHQGTLSCSQIFFLKISRKI